MNPYAVGQRVIFWAYTHLPPNGYEIFVPGDLGVVISLDGQDAIRCLPISAYGEIYPHGDTLFCEEVLALEYAPKLNIPGHLRTLQP